MTYDDDEEFENTVSKLLAFLQNERDDLSEDIVELMDWLEDWFDNKD
jgi:hypothetical protein